MHSHVGIKIEILAEDVKLMSRFMVFQHRKKPKCILNTEAQKHDAQ